MTAHETSATKDVVQIVFDGFNSRDIDRVARICADDFMLGVTFDPLRPFIPYHIQRQLSKILL